MADALDLGSSAARRGGSSPPSRTRTGCHAGRSRRLRAPRFIVCGLLFGDQFDAAVLGASFGSVVGRHEVGLAVAVRM